MKLKLIAGCTLAAIVSSCSTISHTSQTATVSTEVYNLTVADMNVSPQKASTTIDWKWTPFSTVSLETQKENATAELAKATESDVVVEPQFTVKRRGLFRGGSVTVTGYPATYSNFRTMSKDDAEAIAALDGKIALVSPMIGTSSQRRYKKKRKYADPGVNTIDNSRRKFLSAVGGCIASIGSDFNTGSQFGLMYGSYGKRWGWYLKGMFMHASMDNESEIPEKDIANGGQLTFGVIKTITPKWNAYLGAGFGTAFATEIEDGYYRTYKYFDVYPGLPVELGAQWTSGGFNVTAGLNAMFNFDDRTSHSCSLNPYIGIGFSF